MGGNNSGLIFTSYFWEILYEQTYGEKLPEGFFVDVYTEDLCLWWSGNGRPDGDDVLIVNYSLSFVSKGEETTESVLALIRQAIEQKIGQ